MSLSEKKEFNIIKHIRNYNYKKNKSKEDFLNTQSPIKFKDSSKINKISQNKVHNKKNFINIKLFIYVLISIIIILLLIGLYFYFHSVDITNISNISNNQTQIKHVNDFHYFYNESILYIKSDSLLRKSPVSQSDIITVILKGTKVQYLNQSTKDLNGTKYDKVKLIKNDLYPIEYIGFIDHDQLSGDIINRGNNLISLDSKNKIVKEALYWLNSNNSYNRRNILFIILIVVLFALPY